MRFCTETNDVSEAIKEGIVSRFFSKPVMMADINAMLISAGAHLEKDYQWLPFKNAEYAKGVTIVHTVTGS